MSKLDKFKSKAASAKVADDNAVEFPTRQERGTKFVMMALDEAAEFAKAVGTPSAMVWLILFHIVRKTGHLTFSLSNEELAQYGVTRWTKNRVLARLVREGKIEIVQQGHQSVTVKLRAKPKLAK